MAVQTITYEDKQYLNQNADIPATNKVQDIDMNEIKSIVNNNANELNNLFIGNLYSTNETNTYKIWINGKQIYRKVINTGALPNASNKSIPHNITNIETIISLKGVAHNPTVNITYTLPHVHPNDVTYQVGLYIYGENIIISTGIDRSEFTQSYVIIEYTKGD